jgi:hypothetical protein
MSQSQSQSRFNLVLCEIFNRNIHGASSEQIEAVDGHYLLIAKFDGPTRRLLDDVVNLDDDELEDIDDYANFYNDEYYNDAEFAPHIIIQNYQNIVSRPDYIKPEIAECIVLDSHNNVVIIKPIWIKIIQRKWKKIYAERMIVIRRRLQPISLYTREYTGKWPRNCAKLPGLYKLMSS